MRKLAILMLLPLGGCFHAGGVSPLAILDQVRETGQAVSERTAERAASAIDNYCLSVDEEGRMKMREAVNSRTAVGDIEIDCGS